MYTFLSLLIVVAFVALVIGLVKPARVWMSSRKKVVLVYGAAMLVFGGLSAPFIPHEQSATAVSSDATTTTQADVQLTPAQQQQLNDTDYIVSFNGVIVPDFGKAGGFLSAFGRDWQAYNYSAAISDLQSLRAALQATQSDLQSTDQAYKPFSADIQHVDTLTNDAVAAGIKGTNTALADLENGNISGTEDAMTSYVMGTMLNDFTEAKAAAAGWEAKNPGGGE